jgi:hypothetical protein
MTAGGSAPAGAMRAVRRGAGFGNGFATGAAGTAVIGLGAAADFTARGAAGFFLATPSAATRRGAAAGAARSGSSGAGVTAGEFGGEARRGKAFVPEGNRNLPF